MPHYRVIETVEYAIEAETPDAALFQSCDHTGALVLASGVYPPFEIRGALHREVRDTDGNLIKVEFDERPDRPTVPDDRLTPEEQEDCGQDPIDG